MKCQCQDGHVESKKKKQNNNNAECLYNFIILKIFKWDGIDVTELQISEIAKSLTILLSNRNINNMQTIQNISIIAIIA